MIKILKTISKTLVPMNFIKGLAILYTFMIVVGMVGVLESQGLAAYFSLQYSGTHNIWDAIAFRVSTAAGTFAGFIIKGATDPKIYPMYAPLFDALFYAAEWEPWFWLGALVAFA